MTGNNRSTIIIPSSGLIQFRGLLDEYIEYVTTAQMGQQAMMPMGEFGVGAAKKKKRGKKPMGACSLLSLSSMLSLSHARTHTYTRNQELPLSLSLILHFPAFSSPSPSCVSPHHRSS